MDCSPLKPGGLPVVFILMMALAFVGFRGVDGLTLEEICTKLRTRAPDLKIQGFTSDGSSILLVVNNQGFQIPMSNSISNANPKLALFQRGSIQIQAPLQMDTTGFFGESFDGTKGYSDPTAYSLVLFHYVTIDQQYKQYAMFHKTTSVAKQDAYDWTFLSLPDGNFNQINNPGYGYVSDSKQGSARSFALRPLKPTDPKSKIVMSTGNVEANRFGDSPIDNERWYYLDYAADSSTLTISPVPNDDGQMEKESYHSLVVKLPMVGVIYEDKVHLLNTYSGQVFVFDYQDPAIGGNASGQVFAYAFDQYFACNEDQWNSTSQSVPLSLAEPQGLIQELGSVLSSGGGIFAIGAGILAVLIVALGGFFVYKRRSGLKSKLKSTFSSYKSSNLGKTMDKTLDRSKSTTKKASNAVGSIAAKTATSARSALTSATSSAQSTAASTLSKASGSVASSSSSASSRGGSKAGSSMSSTAGSTKSAASSA